MRKPRRLAITGAMMVVVASAGLATGIALQSAANIQFESVRSSIHAPEGWTFDNANSRLAGLFGACPTSAFDVRACPSTVDDYRIVGDYSEEVLVAALQKSGATVIETDCDAQSENATGRFVVCDALGVRGGHVIRMQVIGSVGRGAAVTDTQGRISIDR